MAVLKMHSDTLVVIEIHTSLRHTERQRGRDRERQRETERDRGSVRERKRERDRERRRGSVREGEKEEEKLRGKKIAPQRSHGNYFPLHSDRMNRSHAA
jgi:hypothetical protein